VTLGNAHGNEDLCRGLSSTLKSVLEISLIAPDLLQNLSDVC